MKLDDALIFEEYGRNEEMMGGLTFGGDLGRGVLKVFVNWRDASKVFDFGLC